MLDPDQIKFFREQGYLVLDGVFSPEHISSVREAALHIVKDFDVDKHRTVFSTQDRDAGRDDYFFESAEAVHCFLEEGALDADGVLNRSKELAINKIGHAMHDLVPQFGAFCRLPVIGELLRDIGYHDPLLWQTMYIFKQPGIGGEVRWHQDASYLHTRPASVTGLWVAIEDANEHNGCLWVQPGQHRLPLRERYKIDWETGTGELEVLDKTPWLTAPQVPVEVTAGSLVLFSDHMPHYSAKNSSSHSRHAFTIHVAERGSHWSQNNWLQRPTLGAFRL
ncbi:MAG: phytanoyl-CoA dioxygenase family protein [Gammaproteobacteria bacterium]|nr:phytanoyl-CoA dioxygenase family protein [Gammaproteobacteria bacterium]